MFSMGFGFYIAIRLELGRIGRISDYAENLSSNEKARLLSENGLFLETCSGP
jgi:hypothetical protein